MYIAKTVSMMKKIDLQKLIQYGCLAVEMETSALYMLAARYNVQALGVFYCKVITYFTR